MALIVIALITILSFLSKQPGSLTELWLNMIRQIFGWPGYIIPLPFAAVGIWLIWRHFGNQLPPVDWLRVAGATVVYLGVLTLAHALTESAQPINAYWIDPTAPPEQVWVQAVPSCNGRGARNAEYAARGLVLQSAVMTNLHIAQCGWGGGYVGYLIQNTVKSLLGDVTVYLVAFAALVGGGMMAARLTFNEALQFLRRGAIWANDHRSAVPVPAFRRGAGLTPDNQQAQPAGAAPARGAPASAQPAPAPASPPTAAAAPAATKPEETPAETAPMPPTPGNRPSIVTGRGPGGATSATPLAPASGQPAPATPSSGTAGAAPPGSAAPAPSSGPGSLAIPPRPGSPKPGDEGGPSKPTTSGASPSTTPSGAGASASGSPPKPGGAEAGSAQPAAGKPADTVETRPPSVTSPGAPASSQPRPGSPAGAMPAAGRTGEDEEDDEDDEKFKRPSGAPGTPGPAGQQPPARPGSPAGPGSVAATPPAAPNRPTLPPVPGSRPGQPGGPGVSPSGPSGTGISAATRPGGQPPPAPRPGVERAFGPTPPASLGGARPVPKPGIPSKPAAGDEDDDDDLFDDLAGLRDEIDEELPRPSSVNKSAIGDDEDEDEDDDGDDDDDGGGKPPAPSGSRPGGLAGSPLPSRPGSPSGEARTGGANPMPAANPGGTPRPAPPAPGTKPESQRTGTAAASTAPTMPSPANPGVGAPLAGVPSFKPPVPSADIPRPAIGALGVAAAVPPRSAQHVSVAPADETGQQTAAIPVAAPPRLDASPGKPRLEWTLPPIDGLLNPSIQKAISDEELRNRAKIIEQTLSSFGAPGRVVEVNRGPVITQFGVEPDYIDGRAGKKIKVKVGKISALADDLALSLAAPSIRIEAPVPGKGYVGIEVPNAEPSMVSLRDVIDTPEFRNLKGPLKLALGQDVSGGPIVADLSAMPHLLIAGTTGSGKSVCVNGIICTMLLTHTPEDLKIIMVDPKRVELTNYNGIPHLMAPVVTELERIVGVLKWVQREMDERYRAFAMAGARNITDYNSRVEKGQVREGKQLPYIMVVVDELADLMMLAPDETERVITRLAQMARATGIHIILSTQRPSVDVVTGLIKANFPARIAFAVATGVDSRVILDMPGAEKLLGRGDMLFQAPDAPQAIRMQGTFVSDKEIQKIVDYWRRQAIEAGYSGQMTLNLSGGSPTATSSAIRTSSSAGTAPGLQTPMFDNGDEQDGDADDMFDEAVELVRSIEKASISLLQRHLRIGYTRAARLIDLMEERGVIGPSTGGSKPRVVLGPDGQPLGDVSDDDEADEGTDS